MRQYLLIILFFVAQVLNSQTLIYPASSSPICKTIIVGETISFRANQLGTPERPVCDVTTALGIGIISIDADLDTVLSINEIPLYTFDYTFDEIGEYFLFCGSPTTSSMSASAGGRSNICYNVQATSSIPSIPTLNQWGLIILALILSIVSLVILKRSFFISKGRSMLS